MNKVSQRRVNRALDQLQNIEAALLDLPYKKDNLLQTRFEEEPILEHLLNKLVSCGYQLAKRQFSVKEQRQKLFHLAYISIVRHHLLSGQNDEESIKEMVQIVERLTECLQDCQNGAQAAASAACSPHPENNTSSRHPCEDTRSVAA